MALIGLVIVAAAAVIGIDVAAQNQFDVDLDVFGRTVTTSPSVVFVVGAVAGMACALGILLLIDGTSRRRRLRAEAREAAAERDRMAAAYQAEHPEVARRVETVPAAAPDASNARDGEVDLRDGQREREHMSTF